MIAIARAELVQIFRNRLVLVTALVIPVAITLFFILRHELFAEMGGLGYVGAVVAMSIGAFGLYITAVTTLAARRQTLFLKRLRSTTAGDASILLGLLLPITVITAVLLGALLTYFGVIAEPPANPFWFTVGVVATVAMMIGLALATAGLTRSPEHAQVTTLPISVGVVAVATWVGITGMDDLPMLKRALPGGSATELMSGSWNGTLTLEDSLMALAPTVGWVIVSAVLARRMFRWEPRA